MEMDTFFELCLHVVNQVLSYKVRIDVQSQESPNQEHLSDQARSSRAKDIVRNWPELLRNIHGITCGQRLAPASTNVHSHEQTTDPNESHHTDDESKSR